MMLAPANDNLEIEERIQGGLLEDDLAELFGRTSVRYDEFGCALVAATMRRSLESFSFMIEGTLVGEEER
jgi:hypothetical protein